MDNLPRVKTPHEHHREFVAVAEQQLALACAQSLCDPDERKWTGVINRLSDWVQRLQGDERKYDARRAVFAEQEAVEEFSH